MAEMSTSETWHPFQTHEECCRTCASSLIVMATSDAVTPARPVRYCKLKKRVVKDGGLCEVYERTDKIVTEPLRLED